MGQVVLCSSLKKIMLSVIHWFSMLNSVFVPVHRTLIEHNIFTPELKSLEVDTLNPDRLI